jgi:serine/threonine-protein kinase
VSTFETLGKFKIKRVLGNGAMGEVYLGEDPAIGREVAIKTILPSAAGGPESKERFAREAKAAGVLNHPNLVTIYEFGEDQGVMYIAMELVRGHDLEELMRDQSLTRSEFLELLAQVCDGLDFAHRQHIVHRDIKPSNVRVSRDGKRVHAKVMDFGVARVGNSDMTATGMVMGTVSYMAPEYIRTGKPDPRSDLFAVGVMLYEGLSGRKPFSGDTTPTILYKIVNEPPEPIDLSQLQGISPAIRSVLDNSLTKDPDSRFQTAEEFARALRAAKDPTWQGQAMVAAVQPDATVRLSTTAAMAAAPTASDATAYLPTTAAVGVSGVSATSAPISATEAKASGTKRTLFLAAAGMLLVAGGTGAYLTLRPKPASEPVAEATPVSAPPSGDQAPAQAQTTSGAPAVPLPAATPSTLPTGKVAPPASPSPRGEGRPEPTFEAKPKQVPETKPVETAAPEAAGLERMSPAERMSGSATTLSEAIALADTDPEKALQGIRRAIAMNPGNPSAYAWGVAIAYQQGRYQECRQFLQRARREGVGHQLNANARFRQVLQNERFNRRIPGGLGDE